MEMVRGMRKAKFVGTGGWGKRDDGGVGEWELGLCDQEASFTEEIYVLMENVGYITEWVRHNRS